MIIQPDFLDHWKTQLLVDLLETELAPLYLIRLWAHCQNRKRARFEGMSSRALKAICRYPGDADGFLEALEQAEWVKLENSNLEVCGFEDLNSTLFASWENGRKGGRKPRKNPRDNPPETHGLPIGGAIREEKRRTSPPTPQGATEVEEEISKRGVRCASKALEIARGNGCGIDHIRMVLEHFDSKPGAWDGGALFERLKNLRPEQLAHELWPEESEAYQKGVSNQRRARELEDAAKKRELSQQELEAQRAQELELEQSWGPVVDNLERDAAEKMLRTSLPELAPMLLRSWPRGEPPDGLVRTELIGILEKEESCRVQ